MLITDIPKETKGLLKSEGLTYEDLAIRLGVTRQSVYSTASEMKRYVSTMVIKMMDAMGYDIEIEFVRR